MDSTMEFTQVNPMIDLEKQESSLEKQESSLEKQESSHFGKQIQNDVENTAQKTMQTAQEKLAGKTGVSQNAPAEVQTPIAELMSGAGAGGLYEMVTIGIAFLQSFGLVITIDVQWPESFQKIFEWLEVFSLNFAFGGANLGLWLSIMSGLLVSPIVRIS
ncbi:hypothetical protein TrVE_jg13224 [Triparma verrucosa]|uniref:Uncharacterized protein n=1 Tax=Triparma verrucosa TaxID=1606542 RepID=A0A9W7KWM2_9STRA|nr:hypothetical protein TrVE_jg13224 [Triparma verrucosa]